MNKSKYGSSGKRRGNKHQFDDPIKKKMHYQYKKLLRKEGMNKPVDDATKTFIEHPYPATEVKSKQKIERKGTNRILMAHREIKCIKNEDSNETLQNNIELRQKKRREKIQSHKKLNKRTKKGQPIMRNKMEMMLKKITENKDVYVK